MTHLLNLLPSVHSGAAGKSNGEKYSVASQLGSGAVGWLLSFKDGLSPSEREAQRRRDERRQILRARMQHAKSHAEWAQAACELDTLEGHDQWKADRDSGDYSPSVIEARLRELDLARTSQDIPTMANHIRTGLSRDLGGMGNIDLYRHTYSGTKTLIERYVDSALDTISDLLDKSAHSLPEGLEAKDLLDSFELARQSFGRSALLLSGGGTFGMMHVGVLKALVQARLLPRIISGASAGSIVCSVVCTRNDEELPGVLDNFPYGDLAVFEPEGKEETLWMHLSRMLTQKSWLDIKHLTRVMRDMLGDTTFQEAYNRTRRICNITVSSASMYELPRLLNYITAPNVMIWSAVAASCSVPLVFTAAPLLVKDPRTGEHRPWNPTPQMWIDGSVDNDLPLARLAEMFNVNHFIVSQVNPHIAPFLSKDDVPCASQNIRSATDTEKESDLLSTMTELAKSEVLHRISLMADLGVLPNLLTKMRSLISQTYLGDINILPAVDMRDLPRILKNPTPAFMLRACYEGERATWPKLSRIRDRCAIELALDRAVLVLRARVVFSRSQVDLRRMATGSLSGGNRGSHESMTAQHDAAPTAKAKARQRHRRSSGGSIQLIAQRLRMSDEASSKVTDDESDEEERLEMALRFPNVVKQLRLKRPGRNVSIPSGPLTTPALMTLNDPNSFSFAAELSPKSKPAAAETTLKPKSPFLHPYFPYEQDSAGGGAIDTASMTSLQQDSAADGDLDTTDLPSSDAEFESHTDDDAAEATEPSGIEIHIFDEVDWSQNADERRATARGTPGENTPSTTQDATPDHGSVTPSAADSAGMGLWS